MDKQKRILYLISILSKAAKAYYQDAKEIMTNKEYDTLYDELSELEKETGIIYSNSPTQTVGYEVTSKLDKEKHDSPMLSLDKTKDPEKLKEWLADKEGILSWKLDGLTCVLTYENGELRKAVTRGNGEVGEIVTQNAKTMANVPLHIPFKEKLVIRGETVISYPDFEIINQNLSDEDKYKNPRNLASGSIRQLDSRIAKNRNIRFIAFELVSAEGIDINSIEKRFQWLESLGFEVVERKIVTAKNIIEILNHFSNQIESNPIPSDGLVLTFDDAEYGISLGTTNKFPKHSIAYKWSDDTVETTLLSVEWSTSRTGMINPVAVFEPVELEGTAVSRATLNNVGFIKNLEIGLGDTLSVYKANKIIPTIDDNLTRSNTLEIPAACPACGGKVRIKREKESKILYCTNPDCKAKLLAKFSHFVSRECMNIEGLSDATLEFLLEKGWISKLHHIFELEGKKNEWIHYPGFGIASVVKILNAIENSKKVNFENFIAAQGIEGIGKSQAKVIANEFGSWRNLCKAFEEKRIFTYIKGFGEVLNNSLWQWHSSDGFKEATILSEIVEFVSSNDEEKGDKLSGQIFVITGDLILHNSRKEIQEVIEKAGGKVAGSVSSKTNFLINNDVNSTSSKSKKAKELGVKIITEKDFVQML